MGEGEGWWEMVWGARGWWEMVWGSRGWLLPQKTEGERYELVRAQFNTNVLLGLTILDGGLVVDS